MLNELATNSNITFTQKEQLKKLREAIATYALYEEVFTEEGGNAVYLTCSKTNASHLLSCLKSVKDLVGIIYKFDLTQQNFDEQVIIITKNEKQRMFTLRSALACGIVSSSAIILVIALGLFKILIT